MEKIISYFEKLQPSVSVLIKTVTFTLCLLLLTPKSSVASFQADVKHFYSLQKPSSSSESQSPLETPKSTSSVEETQIPSADDPIIGTWRTIDKDSGQQLIFIFYQDGNLNIVYPSSNNNVITISRANYRVSSIIPNSTRKIDLIMGENRVIKSIFIIADNADKGIELRIQLIGQSYGNLRPLVFKNNQERVFQRIENNTDLPFILRNK